LSAFLFAYKNQIPIFFTIPRRPFRFDYIDHNVDLSFLKLENTKKTLKTFDADKIVGTPKEMVWERILFLLSLHGKVPLLNLCKSMRYNNEALIFANEYSKIAEVSFERCHFFGDDNCHKLLSKEKIDNSKYICYDWIAFNRGGKHEIDFIETDDDFVKYIWFFPSDRIDGNTSVKDACVVSYLEEEHLLDFDYSETMVRFKTIYEMEKRGMKGKFNGYGPNGNPKYYKFRTTHITRRTEKESTKNATTESAIEIPLCSEEDLLKDLSSRSVANDRFLSKL
tara:strand:+ start:3344 stop:4186 length:843 start_codon:yes stop_codon:yes gene_type:complete